MKSWDGATYFGNQIGFILKWKQYESAIILLTVRWYLKYSLSYRDLVEMMSERGLYNDDEMGS
jgi:transposase-like protein